MIHQGTEMEIDHEWVFLPDNGFLEINQDGEKNIHGGKTDSETELVFLTDYFNEEQPLPPSGNSRRVPEPVVPVSFPLEPTSFIAPENGVGAAIDDVSEKIIKEPDIRSIEADDKEVKTQVSNDQSVDMPNIMNSPTDKFDDKNEVFLEDLMEKKVESKQDHVVTEDEISGGGHNLWKWSLTGIGAICSFGVAAATFCIIMVGSQQRHRQEQQINQKLLFQHYSDDDKRMKKQVVHHTTKLNEAISAIGGFHHNTTFGGYYDAL